jgi:hypothetical protein
MKSTNPVGVEVEIRVDFTVAVSQPDCRGVVVGFDAFSVVVEATVTGLGWILA